MSYICEYCKKEQPSGLINASEHYSKCTLVHVVDFSEKGIQNSFNNILEQVRDTPVLYSHWLKIMKTLEIKSTI